MRPTNRLGNEAAMAGIIITHDTMLLDLVRLPGVQAVIVERGCRPSWERELAAAVEGGAFAIERRSLTIRRSEEIAYVLEGVLPHQGLSFASRLALVDDIVALSERLTGLTRASGLLLRIFTEAPTETCGFHVDTVAPGMPPFGLLKVYNGPGTRYVEAGNVNSMRELYAWLGRRERLSREWRRACAGGGEADRQRWRAMMLDLDAALPFLRPGAKVHEVSAGAMVAFRHLDLREHWTDHPVDKAWLHCSPMTGPIRLVVNLTPLRGFQDLRR